eukprot:GILK01002448.1.p1 GENE.GILK01002448.1~~GILK01002448.1.p1  ORF type:complete len:331 (-),score=36.89 GILK01002448.1:92-1084(-)
MEELDDGEMEFNSASHAEQFDKPIINAEEGRDDDRRDDRRAESSKGGSPRPGDSEYRHLDTKNTTPSRIIGVFGMDVATSEDELKEAFSKYGTVEKIDLIKDRVTGQPRGFAFVHFGTLDEAIKAKEEGTGMLLREKPIRIDYSFSVNSRQAKMHHSRGGYRRDDFRSRDSYSRSSYHPYCRDDRDRGYDRGYSRGGGYDREYDRDDRRVDRDRDYDRGFDRPRRSSYDYPPRDYDDRDRDRLPSYKGGSDRYRGGGYADDRRGGPAPYYRDNAPPSVSGGRAYGRDSGYDRRREEEFDRRGHWNGQEERRSPPPRRDYPPAYDSRDRRY